MSKIVQVATSNADVLINATEVASVESQNDNNMNEVTSTDCCPKEKTTVIAIIEGVKQEVKLARTIYSMDVLKKSQEKLLGEICRKNYKGIMTMLQRM